MVARGHGSTNLPLARHGSEAGHTDTEEEFVFMKGDLKRVKAVLREKLVLLGMSRTRPEQLAPESGPWKPPMSSFAKIQTTKRKKTRMPKRRTTKKEDEGYSE